MTIIRDAGSGNAANVNDESRLQVESVQTSELHDISHDKGLAFNWTMVDYDYDAADTIIYIQNDSSDKVLIIDEIIIYSDTATVAEVHILPATASPAGTAIVGANLNSGNATTASATAKGDETGNTQGTIIFAPKLLANTPFVLPTNGSIILNSGRAIGVDLVTAGTGCGATITGYYL